MNPTLKKVVAALAIKEGIERIQELRQPPRPSRRARLGKLVLFGAIGGGIYYLYKSGRLHALVGKAKAEAEYRRDPWAADTSPVQTAEPPIAGGLEGAEPASEQAPVGTS